VSLIVPTRVLTAPMWRRYTLTHAGLTAAAASETVTLEALPAGSVVHAVLQKHSTAFSGGSASKVESKVVVADANMAAFIASCNSYWTLAQTSGNRADSVGGMTLTDNNTVGYGTDRRMRGFAECVAANSEYLSAADHATLSMGDIAVTFGVDINVRAATVGAVFGKWNSTTANQEYVLYVGAGRSLNFYVQAGGVQSSPATIPAQIGEWMSVAIQHNPTTNVVRIRGNNGPWVEVSWSGGILDGSNEFRVGRDHVANYVEASIARLWIRKAIVDDATLAWLHNGGLGRDASYEVCGTLTVSDAVADEALLLDERVYQADHGASASLQVTVTAAGDTVNNLSAGELDVWALVSEPLATIASSSTAEATPSEVGQMRVLTGANFNLLRRGVVTLTSGTAESSFPLTNVYDMLASEPLIFTAAGTPRRITVDLDYLQDQGAFESLTGWTDADAGTGVSALDASPRPGSGGTNAVKLTCGATGAANKAERYKDVTVPAGKKIKLYAYHDSDGTGVARLIIQNLRTGYYLTAAGAWSATIDYAIASTSTAYPQSTVTFTVQSFSTCKADEVTLRITVQNITATSDVWFDEVHLVPAVDVTSIHGHNFPPSATITVLSSDDNFSTSTTRFTLTGAIPSCGEVLGAVVYARYWRLNIADSLATPQAAWRLGEWILGETYTLTQQPRHPGVAPWSFSKTLPQVANATELGEETRIPLTEDGQRTRTYPFRDVVTSTLTTDLDEVVERSRYGTRSWLLIPDDTGTEALLVRLSGNGWSAESLSGGQDGWDRALAIQELPFPVVTT
jgi:hypothetical protein